MRSLFRLPTRSVCDFPRILSLAASLSFSLLPAPATCSTLCLKEEPPQDSADLLRQWGCSDDDISKLFSRRPSLRGANLAQLRLKLQILTDVGITGPDLVKVIHCRPRFLSCRIDNHLEDRLQYFISLYGSKEVLRRAIVRNPSILTYDFPGRIKATVDLYEKMGVSKVDLVPMLMSRPTLIPRTSLENEKLDYIRRTGVPQNSKSYKYVVTIMAVSRLTTIREKVANLEKFGFSEEEVLRLFGRSPFMLTFSIDKIQRNMTFILGIMKLPAKIQDMGLSPQIQGPSVFRALRMTESRFLKAFVGCHTGDVANELMEFYNTVKGVKRLAEASKKNYTKGFPF
ncbi:uncharacterized protein LOC115755868 isoform X2 [Rhodamnia argentea]|uniref:Uncharacterized protein LOC115755868 isoform X2 n=1 Tax=Rhodamnia argentea TaxID=178133 RepID=A0ABM3HJM1_9MYRT|nr:uncharacterized protein LOC115755868 isoform X2 [Rhodamnia argentea]